MKGYTYETNAHVFFDGDVQHAIDSAKRLASEYYGRRGKLPAHFIFTHEDQQRMLGQRYAATDASTWEVFGSAVASLQIPAVVMPPVRLLGRVKVRLDVEGVRGPLQGQMAELWGYDENAEQEPVGFGHACWRMAACSQHGVWLEIYSDGSRRVARVQDGAT